MPAVSLKKASLAVLLFLSQNLLAQQPVGGVEMADQLRADGKIWVVVLVLAVVFAGIITYLIRLDRQVSKLEKEINEKKTETIR
ncbi:MAG: CcmD family protein [Bacteroidetes bacterium]|nr:CcmD family protein [Fibrella sp.]